MTKPYRCLNLGLNCRKQDCRKQDRYRQGLLRLPADSSRASLLRGQALVVGLASLLLTFSLAASSFANTLSEAELLALSQQFESHFDRIIQRDDLPGGAFVVTNAEQTIKLATTGKRRIDANELITPDTVFRLASVSKTFTAGLVAQLIEHSKLRWSTRIASYVPEFNYVAAEQLQIEDLLGQTTGIVGHAWDSLIEDNWQLAAILPRFAELKPICKIGQCYSYQNVAFSLIEPVITDITQTDFASSMQRYLFEPLGMQHSSVGMDELLASAEVALPHRYEEGAWRIAEVLPTYYRIPAAAGVNASISDLAIWLRAQLGAYPEVLSKQSLTKLSQPRIQTPQAKHRRFWQDLLSDAHYGLGWRIYESGQHRIIYHGGFVMGYRSELAYSPELGIGFALLLNSQGPAASEMVTSFWQQVWQAVANPEQQD